MIEIKVPSVGESVQEGRISRWLKTDGSSVQLDEPVFELETDKATQEIASPAAGVLKILVPEGQTVQVGQLVAQVDPAGKPTTPTQQAVPAPKKEQPTPQPTASQKEVVLSPSARRIVEEEKINLATVQGTGPGGRIIKDDVLNLQTKPNNTPATNGEVKPISTPSVPSTSERNETRQKMTGIRSRIAERLVHSQQSTATLTTFNEADMTAISDLRNRFKDKFKEKHGVGLGFMSFFVKATIEALKAFPLVNARIDGMDIVHQHYYDISVAVSTERGLMVPILRDADRMSFAGIEKKIAELAVRARDGKINVQDLQGGTFTITNGGVFGSMLSTPILNPPQTAILGMHAIQKRAVVVNDQIAIRPMMYLALSYDHRLIDGREAVQFLVRIKECVENPERMLLEI